MIKDNHSTQTGKVHLFLLTVTFLLLALCNLGGSSAGASRAEEERISLLFVPPLIVEVDADGQRSKGKIYREIYGDYRGWLERLSNGIRSDIIFEISTMDPSAISDETYDSLAEGEQGTTSAILAELSSRENTQGAITIWYEKLAANENRVVVVLYLPNRIKVLDLKASINFERRSVESGNNFQKPLKTAVERQILAISSPQETPPATGGPPPSSVDPPSLAPKEVDLPLSVSILRFSRDWIQNAEEVENDFGHLPGDIRSELLPLVREEWSKYVDTHKIFLATADPLAYSEVAAPAFAIDADPKALEKKLARISKDERADLLVFGHFHQDRDAKGELGMNLVVRAFATWTSTIYSYEEAILPKRRQKVFDSAFQASIEAALREISTEIPWPGQEVDYILYTIRSGDSLIKIAKRCYNDDSLYPKIHDYNKQTIPNQNNLNPKEQLKLPRVLGGKNVDTRKCGGE